MESFKGIILKVISTLTFAIMVALIKKLSNHIPVGEILFSRSFFAIAPILVMMIFTKEFPGGIRTSHLRWHLLRGVVGTISMIANFTALIYLPLANATAISFTTPLLVVVFAMIFLGELVLIYRWLAVGVGFIGVIVMLSPHLDQIGHADGESLGAFLAMIGAIFGAFGQTVVRKLIRTDRTMAIVFYFSFISSLFALFTLPFGWVIPTLSDALMLITTGVLGGVAQIFLITSFRYADASLIAPFDYMSMLWALVIGFFIFDEVPEGIVMVGAVIVMGSGIFIILREHQLGIRRDKSRSARIPT